MTGKELLDAGDLDGAIAQTGSELGQAPDDGLRRTFLFELLCFAGELDRASKQLDVLGAAGTDRDLAVQPYRNLLDGEKARRRVFTEGVVPGLPNKVPPYTRLHLEAIVRVRDRQYAEALALLHKAEDCRPAVGGNVNGQAFEDLKDADDLIGPFLEVIVGNTYSWVPWESVRSITAEAPKYLRDLVWLPATVELDIGPLGAVFLPALYVDSYRHEDSRVRLGRMTDWRGDTSGLSLGQGQRLLVAGEDDWPLLELRELAVESMGESHGYTSTHF